jgi:hypothetical protein
VDEPITPPAIDAYARFAGACALLAAISGFLYTAFFAAAARGRSGAAKPSAVLLMVTGLLAIPVVVGVYERLRPSDPGFALLGLVFGLLGAAGAFLHGGYDLAVLLKPAGGTPIGASQVDPRGLLTFGATALALFVWARLIVLGRGFPQALAGVAALLGLLLVVVYLGRLILLDPNRLVVKATALLAGFVVAPIWYVWVGTSLRGRRPRPAPEPVAPTDEE